MFLEVPGFLSSKYLWLEELEARAVGFKTHRRHCCHVERGPSSMLFDFSRKTRILDILVTFPKFEILVAAAAAAKSLKSCPTLCVPIDGSPPGSPVPGICRARILE